jgi:hypothetical protein
MTTIEVDFDVFKELTVRRRTEATTYNDVIRELLRLPLVSRDATPTVGLGWVQKGVTFPNGTEFRATYKGATYLGKVVNELMIVNGNPVKSLSEAAHQITGTSINGWRFWFCRLPNAAGYVLADSLKK